MKLLSTTALILLTTTANAENLTILNSGSETGGMSAIAMALTTDLGTSYTIDYQNPGKHCVAMNVNFPQIAGPLVMPYGNDFEAAGRDGESCAVLPIKAEQVIAYAASPLFVCSMTAADITKISGIVGYTTPDYAFARVVSGVNSSFGTEHKGVSYNGSGDARAALLNGEINYALLSEKHAKKVMKEGATCDTSTADTGDNSLISMSSDNNESLVIGFTTVLLAINADAQAIKTEVQAAYNNPNSAFGAWSGGKSFEFDSGEVMLNKYEQSVVKLQK
jgi:hypothetical protein